MSKQRKIHLAWKNDERVIDYMKDNPRLHVVISTKSRMSYAFEIDSTVPIIRRKDAFDAIQPFFSSMEEAAMKKHSRWHNFFCSHNMGTLEFKRKWHEGIISVDSNELSIFTNVQKGDLFEGMAITDIGKPAGNMVPVRLEDNTNRLLEVSYETNECEVFSFVSWADTRPKRAAFADELIRTSFSLPTFQSGSSTHIVTSNQERYEIIMTPHEIDLYTQQACPSYVSIIKSEFVHLD